MALNLKREF